MTGTRAEGLVDVRLGGRNRVVAVYVVDTSDGPALIDCGPASTLDALKDGLAALGLAISDLRHVLITHIHLDHAGAAGHLARENPQLLVHVSEVGFLHMAFPEVLEFSARGVYGDRYDALWGVLAPVPEANLRMLGDEVAGVQCVPTPGHASHHVSFVHDDTIYAGDSAGVRIMPGTHITAPTLPPDVDVEQWLRSIDAMAGRSPTRLALTHFGFVNDPAEHLDLLRGELGRWLALVKGGVEEAEFVRIIATEVTSRGEQADYHETLPMEMLYRGLRQYVDR